MKNFTALFSLAYVLFVSDIAIATDGTVQTYALTKYGVTVAVPGSGEIDSGKSVDPDFDYWDWLSSGDSPVFEVKLMVFDYKVAISDSGRTLYYESFNTGMRTIPGTKVNELEPVHFAGRNWFHSRAEGDGVTSDCYMQARRNFAFTLIFYYETEHAPAARAQIAQLLPAIFIQPDPSPTPTNFQDFDFKRYGIELKLPSGGILIPEGDSLFAGIHLPRTMNMLGIWAHPTLPLQMTIVLAFDSPRMLSVAESFGSDAGLLSDEMFSSLGEEWTSSIGGQQWRRFRAKWLMKGMEGKEVQMCQVLAGQRLYFVGFIYNAEELQLAEPLMDQVLTTAHFTPMPLAEVLELERYDFNEEHVSFQLPGGGIMMRRSDDNWDYKDSPTYVCAWNSATAAIEMFLLDLDEPSVEARNGINDDTLRALGEGASEDGIYEIQPVVRCGYTKWHGVTTKLTKSGRDYRAALYITIHRPAGLLQQQQKERQYLVTYGYFASDEADAKDLIQKLLCSYQFD